MLWGARWCAPPERAILSFAMGDEFLSYLAVAFSTVFFVVDPFAAVPLFIAMTEGDTDQKRRVMAKRAAITVAVVLLTMGFLGTYIFKLFGVTLPAFRIAGGILLLLLAIDMVRAEPSRTRSSPEETREGVEKADVAIIPLAIPMLSGPGAIASTMVLAAEAKDWRYYLAIGAAIVGTAIASYFVLRATKHIERVLRRTGLNILNRLMGMVLCAIGVQFMVAGLGEMLPGLVK
jgi:multiple antibiotic resistance protein